MSAFKKIPSESASCNSDSTSFNKIASPSEVCLPSGADFARIPSSSGDCDCPPGPPGPPGKPGADGTPKNITLDGTPLPSVDTLNFEQGAGIDILATTPSPGVNSLEFSLENSGVIAATYGDADSVPVIDIDQYGRITSAANASILIGNTNITDLDGSKISGSVANSNTSVNFSGNLSGDVTGTQSSTSVDKIRGNNVASGTLGPPDAGKVLTWSGSSWSGASPAIPTDSQILISPADNNNASGTWQGLIPSGTMTLKQAIDRTGTYLGWGRIFIPQAQDSGGTPTSTPSPAGDNKLESILNVLYWRSRPVAVMPATPNITVYTDGAGAITYGRLPFAAFTQVNARSLVGNSTNATANATNLQDPGWRQSD